MKAKKVSEILGINTAALSKKIKENSLSIAKSKGGQNIFKWENIIQLRALEKYEDKITQMPPKVISICQNKGGVGKTTSVINFGTAFSYLGKTLLVDLDGQSNLSQAFDIYLNEGEYSASDVFDNVELVDKAIRKINDNLHVLPNHLKFEKWKKNNRGNTRSAFIMKKILKEIKNNYKFILIDTPSALDIALEMALYASDYCLIPFEAQPFSLEGITNILDEISNIQENEDIIEFNLKNLGIFINIYEKNKLSQQISELVMTRFNAFETKIRKIVGIQQSQAIKSAIFDFDESSNAAFDYYNLTFEILDRLIEA